MKVVKLTNRRSMNRVKNEIKKGFSIIPNELINDPDVSPVAKFIYCYMAEKPNDWKFFNKDIMKAAQVKDPRTFRKHMTELITPGWVTRARQRGERSTFDSYEYTVHGTPVCKKCTLAECSPVCIFCTVQKMHDAKNAHITKKNLELKRTYNKEEERAPGLTAPHFEIQLKSKKHIKLLIEISGKNKDIFSSLEEDQRKLFFDWLNYRTEINDNYRTQRGFSLPLKILSEYSRQDAEWIFGKSMDNEWKGLFPEKLSQRNNPPKYNNNAKDNEPRFGAATHKTIANVLERRRQRREAV